MKEQILPLAEAIEVAAKQNFERDQRVEQFGQSMSWPEVAEIYREEAQYLLETTGENYLPDYDDHPHIKVIR